MHAYLLAPVSAAPLVTFRIVMGGMLLFSTLRFMWLGWIEDHFLTTFQFKYYGFYWLPNLPKEGLYLLHIAMLLGALGVMTNVFYRLSAIVLFVTFTYIELIDLTYYLNHYYFVSIVLFLLIFSPADRSPQDNVPRWTILIFQVQLGIVYFYAGIAKINYDWLINALPLKIWLPAQDKMPLIGWIFTFKITPYLFSWAGMLYDCFVPFLLAWRKTRLLAYLAVIAFHTLTGLMFQIGVFPLVMIGATLIFFSEKWHKQWYKYSPSTPQPFNPSTSQPLNPSTSQPFNLSTLLPLYLTFQLLFPFRYLLYEGDLFWTEEGYRFSWRVMLMEKAGTATFYVRDSRTGKEGVVDNREFLNVHQEKQMSMQPDMILQFAHFLGKHYAGKGIHKPQVRAEVYVTLNGRPSRLLIKPDVDLTRLQDGWAGKDWILRY